MKDGGWMDTEKGWVLHPSEEPRVRENHRATMARIDKAQAHYPTCALCGQRCIKLDRFGLCSKEKGEHAEWRADARREEKAGVR